MRAALFALLLASPALAEEPSRVYIPAHLPDDEAVTWVEIRESTEPGASAEVEFRNRPVNVGSHNGVYALTWDGVTISVTFEWNVGALGEDRAIITPPMGYDCWPACEITAPEGGGEIVFLFPAVS